MPELLKLVDLRDKLILRNRVGEGEFEGTHFEAGTVGPYSMYVEACGKALA